MPKRVWEYNVAATLTHDCSTYSFVIYLMPDGNKDVPRPLMTWGLPQRGRVHTFEFTNIELWTQSVEALWEPGLLGILPLSLLAADGMRREVCEAVCERVKVNSDLLALTLTLATMVFTSQADQQWLRRKVGMFEDLVRDTWFYQHILEQGIEQERERGLRAARLDLLDLVQARFPDMADLVQQRVNAMHDEEVLRRLILKIVIASTEEEARRSLLEAPGFNGV